MGKMAKQKKGKEQQKLNKSDNIESNNAKLSNEGISKKRKRESDNLASKKLKPESDSLVYKIIFPAGGSCYKEAIKKVLNICDKVFHPEKFCVEFASKEEAQKKVAELEKITVGGYPLTVKQTSERLGNPLKRVIYLITNFNETDKLKSFYGAQHVEQSVTGRGNLSNKFILTFESETKAQASEKKLFDLNGTPMQLHPFAGKSPRQKTEEGKKKQLNANLNGEKKGKQKQINQQKKNKPKSKKKNEQEKEEEEEEDVESDQDD